MIAPERMTVPRFAALKAAGRKIAVLTAYDYPTARLVDRAGVDAILVGDSLGMVVQGRSTTLPVTLDQMIYHAEMVARAAPRALVVVDLPFGAYQLGSESAIAAAVRVMKETLAQAVKLEGGADQAAIIAALVAAGVPVVAHVGLRPQAVHQFGRYSLQRDEERLMTDAKAAAQAGAFAIVLECIAPDVAAHITRSLNIPTIGIGSGVGCDGQVLVLHDMLGLGVDRVPRHVKGYAQLGEALAAAVAAYCEDVRAERFPGDEQTLR